MVAGVAKFFSLSIFQTKPISFMADSWQICVGCCCNPEHFLFLIEICKLDGRFKPDSTYFQKLLYI